jgi:hypothetical protein
MVSCSTTKPSPSKPTLKRGDSPRSVTKITETESSVDFQPFQVTKEVGQVKISITPMDVNDVNNITYEASNFSGEYKSQNFNIQSYEESLREKSNPNLSSRKSDLYLSMISYLKSLNRAGDMSDKVLSSFIQKIASNNIGDDVFRSKIEVLDTGIDTYNPFKKDGKNFSVFQIDFINDGSENATFDIGDFVISSGFEQLNPYSDDFYSKLYSSNLEKLQLAKRLNMPDQLVIPSNSKVRRYFSITPLNLDTKSLSVKLIDDKVSTSFNYDVESKTVSKAITFYNHIIEGKDNYKYGYDKYFAVLESEDGEVMIVKTENLKIPENSINGIFNLYAIGFDGPDNRSYSLGILKGFKFSNILSKEVRVNYLSRRVVRK